MTVARTLLSAAIGLAVSGASLADLTPVPPMDRVGTQSLNSLPLSQVTRAAWPAEGEPARFDLSSPLGFRQTALTVPVIEPEQSTIRQLPAGPGSTTLFLLGMGSVGAWQLARSARKMHFGATPEWYHAHGHSQVGHATPLNLDFSLQAMPICTLATVDAHPCGSPPQAWLWRVESIYHLQSQQSILATKPRGPPSTV